MGKWLKDVPHAPAVPVKKCGVCGAAKSWDPRHGWFCTATHHCRCDRPAITRETVTKGRPENARVVKAGTCLWCGLRPAR